MTASATRTRRGAQRVSQRVAQRVARRVALRAGFGLAAVIAIYVWFAHTAAGQRFDDAAKLYAVTNQIHFRRLETLASFVVVVAIVIVLGALATWARDHSLSALAWSAFAVLPPWLLAELGKVALPRPHLHATPRWIGSASFPSGHVTITASCLFAMVALVPPWHRRSATTLAVVTLITSMTFVITSGMHRPSDVFAAPVVALTWLTCVTADASPSRRALGTAARRWLVAAAALAVVGVALGSAALRSATGGSQHLPAQTVINHASYGAVLVAIAIAVVVGVVAYELLGPVSPACADYSPTSTGSAQTSAA